MMGNTLKWRTAVKIGKLGSALGYRSKSVDKARKLLHGQGAKGTRDIGIRLSIEVDLGEQTHAVCT